MKSFGVDVLQRGLKPPTKYYRLMCGKRTALYDGHPAWTESAVPWYEVLGGYQYLNLTETTVLSSFSLWRMLTSVRKEKTCREGK